LKPYNAGSLREFAGYSHSYETWLSQLGIESLEARRIKADVLYVYKFLFNLVDFNSVQFFYLIG